MAIINAELKRLAPLPVRSFKQKLVRSWSRNLDALHRSWLKRRWLANLPLDGGFVHPSIELLGRKQFHCVVVVAAGCWIERDCTLWISDDADSRPEMRLGNIYVGRNCYLGAFQPLEIGDDTLIGAYSYIISGNHRNQDRFRPVRAQGYEGAPIRIGKDVWIGCHVTVLPGVTIGDQAIIGAGAVVTKSVPAGESWAGVPARKIGER